MRTHAAGTAEQQFTQKAHIFALIEAFFRRHLMPVKA
jgi:hypothetical protein